jgi:hypothetical protein
MTFSLKHGIYAHPFEFVACVSTFLSVYGAFQLLLYHPDVLDNATQGILSVPKYLLWVWVVTGFLGAVATASGLALSIFSPKGRVLEEQGLWLMGAMWLSAGVVRAVLDLEAWVEYIRYFAIAGGCILRLMMLNDFHDIMTRWREAEKV